MSNVIFNCHIKTRPEEPGGAQRSWRGLDEPGRAQRSSEGQEGARMGPEEPGETEEIILYFIDHTLKFILFM